MIRNIIFDWSGTLIDDLQSVWKATNAVLEAFTGKSMSLEEFRNEFQLPFQGFYQRFLPGIDLKELEKVFHGHYQKMRLDAQVLPHAAEFLAFCRRQGIRNYILSTVSDSYFHGQAAQAGLDGLFERTYLGVHDKLKGAVQLIHENGLDPKETLFIGDMRHDIDAARFAGLGSCAVLTGYNRLEQLMESRPDVVVEHLGELTTILEASNLNWPPAKLTREDGYPIPTVGALILNHQNELLMIRTSKWSDKWGIPGGKIKYGESSLAALEREIREETDLEIRDVRFVMVQDCIESPEFYRREHFILLNYICRVNGSDGVRLNEEAQAFQWITAKDALGRLELNRPTRILINRALELGLTTGVEP